MYSDLHINSELKVEILPTDKIYDEAGLFTPGDRYLSIYRPIENSLLVDILHKFFIADFMARVASDGIPIDTALAESIQAVNVSFITPARSGESIPKSGAFALVLYLSPDNRITYAQVGQISLKKKKSGKFSPISQSNLDDFFLGSLGEGSWLSQTNNNAMQFISSFQL